MGLKAVGSTAIRPLNIPRDLVVPASDTGYSLVFAFGFAHRDPLADDEDMTVETLHHDISRDNNEEKPGAGSQKPEEKTGSWLLSFQLALSSAGAAAGAASSRPADLTRRRENALASSKSE